MGSALPDLLHVVHNVSSTHMVAIERKHVHDPNNAVRDFIVLHYICSAIW